VRAAKEAGFKVFSNTTVFKETDMKEIWELFEYLEQFGVDGHSISPGYGYSAVNDRMSGTDSSSQKFLRGYQVTDAKGTAAFTTIYPGWYRGRTVHIHFKIRTPATAALADRREGTYEFTSQLFFDEALTDQVHAQAPYSQKGRRDTLITADGIFRSGGTTLLVPLAASGGGYAGRMYVGVTA